MVPNLIGAMCAITWHIYDNQENLYGLVSLQGKNLNDLYMSIFKSRENLYSQADLRIQVKRENIEEVAMKIINAIHKEIIS